MLTLSQFIEQQLKIYGVQSNEQNRKKIYLNLRAKFTTELKKLGIWQKAETKLIGKTQTKVFTPEDLRKLAKNTHDYMTKFAIKQSGLSQKEVQDRKKKNQEELQKDYEYQLAHGYDVDPYGPEQGKALHDSLNDLMLKALFDKFFTMTEDQKAQFAQDRGYAYYDPEELANSELYVLAKNRLDHPLGNYYTEK